MNIRPKVAEVWFADLGIAAKSRPVLVLAVPGEDEARNLVVVAPLAATKDFFTTEGTEITEGR